MTASPAEIEVLLVVAGAAAAAALGCALARLRPPALATRAGLWTALAAGLAFLTYAALGLLKLRAYNMGAEDLGRIDQAIWSVLAGRPLVFSASEIGRDMSRLAGHVELLYFPLAPLFWLWDSAGALVVAQAAAVAAGAWPAYRLGRAVASPALGLAAAVAYLAHPAVGSASLADVHGDTLAMPLLLLALERAWASRRAAAIGAMALAVSGKEYVALLAISSGFLVWWMRRERAIALAWIATGGLWLLVVVPALHARYRPPDFPALTPTYYGRLGDTPGEVALAALRRPHDLAAMILTPRKMATVGLLLAPFGHLGLLSPLPLAAAVPVLLPLAATEQLNYRNHHNATLVPFLVLAGLLGARRLVPRNPHLPILAATALVHLTLGPTPLSVRSWTPGRWDYLGNPHLLGRNDHHDVLDRAVALVPRAARVTATGHVVPRLSHREVCFTFPAPADAGAIDVAVVDLAGGHAPHWRPRRSERAALGRLLATPGFELAFARDGVFVVARSGLLEPWSWPCDGPPPADQPLGLIALAGGGGAVQWVARQELPPSLLVLDERDRTVWLLAGEDDPAAPARRLAPGPIPNLLAAAGACAPPPGTRLLVVAPEEGFPLVFAGDPPQPWLPEPTLATPVVR